MYPSLSLSAYAGTNYFSAAQEVSGTEIEYSTLNLEIDGVTKVVKFPNPRPSYKKTPFGTQLKNNLSQNISLNLNIPILGAWQRRTAISNAKLNLQRTQLDIDEKQQQLDQEIFTAYTDFKMAYSRYQTTQGNIAATEQALNYANQKYKAGMLNALEYETAKNRNLSAKAEQLQAKYEYFFRKIILDYYKTGTFSW